MTTHTILSHTYISSFFLITKGFLGAAAASAGIAITSSISGSGLPSVNLPIPKIEMKAAAPAKIASAPQSKIAFTKAPKGKSYFLFSLISKFLESMC